jgi:hypothetical protein
MNDDQQQEERDKQMLAQEAITALVCAKSRTLSEDEIMAIAWSAGLSNDVYKELRK